LPALPKRPSQPLNKPARGTNKPRHGPPQSWAGLGLWAPKKKLCPQYFRLPPSGSEPTSPLLDAIIAASTLILASSPGLGRGFSCRRFFCADTERRPSLAVGSASRLPPHPSMEARRRPERDEGRAAASPVRSFLFFSSAVWLWHVLRPGKQGSVCDQKDVAMTNLILSASASRPVGWRDDGFDALEGARSWPARLR
jgi:hypothetical protein